MRSSGPGYANWPPFAGVLAIGGCISCFVAKACHEPQEAAPAVPRGTAAGSAAWRTQASAGNQGADGAAARANQRWTLDFLSRCVGRRPPIPYLGGRRRLHPGVPGAGRRHLVVRASGRSRARCADLPAAGRDDRLRQRHGADRHGDLALVQERRVEWHYIAPGKPQQNAFIESFNGRLRDELLNETLFASLDHAREAAGRLEDDYNTVRPHSALGNLPPAAYAEIIAPGMQRDGALALCRGLRAPSRCITEPTGLK